MVRTDQTHTATVLVVGEEHLGMGITREREYTDVDGLVTACRDITLITSHGDCNALFFYDPEKGVIGLAYSGWRGTLKEIGSEMVRVMVTELGCREADILAGIGPALCQDCFEIDQDVAQLFYEKNPAWTGYSYRKEKDGCTKHYLDLKSVLRHTLLDAGVKGENIFDMELCNRCHPELFYSYRRQKGKNGNMVSAMRLKPLMNR
jgi:YfiH family protein